MTHQNRGRVAVIGAGIVGLCTAAFLQRLGCRVTLVDPEEPGTMTSFGNAGAIAAHAVVPMSMPGIWKKIPGWLLAPSGPLAVRPGYAARALPWLIRFMRAAAHHEAQARALAELYRPARDAYLELTDNAGAAHLLKQAGALTVYETAGAFEGDSRARSLIRGHGHRVEELDPEALRHLEPGLAPIFNRAAYFPDAAHCTNPGELCRLIAAMVLGGDGGHLRARVAGFEHGPEGVVALRTDTGERHAFDRFVVTAGAWSHRLSALLGERFPLESERGYHMTLPHPGIRTGRPVIFAERRFMATTMDMGLRLAGTVEFAGLTAPPNWARADMLVHQARSLFPDADLTDGRPWMGQRPATPDSLPVIGRSARHRNVFYGFGHGHLGLTAGAVTGRHLAALAAGHEPGMDLAPFRIDRYR